MCGIFGVVYSQDHEDLGQILTQAAKSLTYRGYDSVGAVSVTVSGHADLRKDVGKVDVVSDKLKFVELCGNRGITQLRWATFGVPAQRNAQPHFDTHGKLVGAHNGNVVNTVHLIKELTAKGHVFRGENDGEVVVHVIEDSFNNHGDMDLAIREARKILKGDYAFVITALKGDKLYCAKMGSSLYMGIGKDFICCSSDLPSILNLTNRIVPLLDGEYVEFNNDTYEIKNINTGAKIDRDPIDSPFSPESASKGDFPFFMEKEIFEQPERAQALLNFLEESDDVKPFAQEVADCERVYLVGSGSSYNSCVIGSYYLNKLAGCSTFPVVAGSFIEHFGEGVRPNDLFILVSQSGETKDVINVLNMLTQKGMANNVLGVVNVLGSTLMMRSRRYLPLLSNLEIAVAATKTFINQCVLFLGLAIEVAKLKGMAGDLPDIFKIVPKAIQDTIDKMNPQAKELAVKYKDCVDMYTLGYGVTYGSALEAAQKIKEISYAHCEGLYSAEFKHGPLAIVTEGYPVFYLTTVEDSHMTLSHINEVTCRWGHALTVAPYSELLKNNSTMFFELPYSDYSLVPILSVVFMQLFSYHLTVEKGYSPDYPRNCSKTITVD
jgi:glucosamine--fructose-6-phosphate aminotransferase (isomerizing)